MRPDEVWGSFLADPRPPATAGLRASDADRDVVHRMLTEAYADGRLDREELDARSAATGRARTLGELVDPLDGLVPVGSPLTPPSLVPAAELDQRALESWRSDRRQALWGLLSVSAIVWTIWVVTSWGPGGFDPYFPWPIFVSMAALLNLGKTHVQRDEIVAEERQRLEKKQRKAIEKQQREDEDP